MTNKFTKIKSKAKLIFLGLLGSFAVNQATAQYCTPEYESTGGCLAPTGTTGSTINSVSTTGAIVNLSNPSTGCGPTTSSGYVDYTSSTSPGIGDFTVMKATPFNITVNVINWGGGIKIWIDLNNNSIFEDSELMLESPTTISAGSSFSGNITVPLWATTGTTRMRIRDCESSTSFDACSYNYWGETEDYLISIVDPPVCSGPISAGTLVAVDSICPSTSFNLNSDGATSTFSGLTFQWQSSATSGGPYTDIAGATTLPYVHSGITTATYFRLRVSCSDGSIAYSDEKLINVKSFISCYCTPIYTYGCGGGSRINDFYTSGAVADISNMGTGCGSVDGTGYTDYTDDIPALQVLKGVDFNATVGITNWDGGVSIWIDMNQNGIFETSELVLASPDVITTGTSFTGIINIPVTAGTGLTRMRIRTYDYGVPDDPCSTLNWGEAEDYYVNMINPTPCTSATEPIVAGTVSSVDSICPSVPFMLTAPGTTVTYSGLTFQWQSSTSPTGPFVNVVGGSAFSFLNPGITENTYFRLIVSCGSTSDTTEPKLVNVKSFIDCYCEPEATYGCYYGSINDFSTSGAAIDINNMGTGCSDVSSYVDYTSNPDLQITAIKTVPFNATVNLGSVYENGIKAWIDYDHNGIFDPSEIVINSPDVVFPGTPLIETITVPTTALEGVTRMRVRVRPWSTFFGPCTLEYYGETEDYLINIVNPISCTEAVIPSSIEVSATPTSVCSGDKTVLKNATTLPIAFGYTYKWKYGPTATGPFTYLTPDEVENATVISNNITSNTYFVMELFCDGSLIRTSSPVLVTPVIPSIPTYTDSQICGPGEGILTASTPSGSIFWYASPTAPTPIAEGTTFFTPSLTTTTSYWVSSGAFPASTDTLGTSASTSSTSDPGPFNKSFENNNIQLVYTKTQLVNAGVEAGKISSIMFYVETPPTSSLINYNISWKQNSMPLPLNYSNMDWIPALTSGVVAPTTAGWYEISLPNPIYWDGESNLLLNICYNVPTGMTASEGTYRYTNKTGQMVTKRNNTAGADACNLTATAFSNTKLPNIIFVRSACESDRNEVVLNVRDTPSVTIVEPNGTYCMNLGVFQINTSVASTSPVTYLWNNGATTPNVQVSTSGTYSVVVTNEFGCSTSDVATYTLNPSPIVNLGPDKIVCEDGDLTLDATDASAASYYWNTGATTPAISVTDGGNYVVYVTNGLGCIGSDTINVVVSGFLPYMAGISVNAITPTTFSFTPISPNYITTYKWDFGDGTPVSYSSSPTHPYTSPGTYLVTCTVTSSCGTKIYKTFATTVTSIDNSVFNNSILMYPNPAQEKVTIKNDNNNRINKITVINSIGQVLSELVDINSTSTIIDVSNMPSGNYVLFIETNDGNAQKKLTIQR